MWCDENSSPSRKEGDVSFPSKTSDQSLTPCRALDQAGNGMDALRKEGVALTVSMLSSFLQEKVPEGRG
jgi:hypothetical protein